MSSQVLFNIVWKYTSPRTGPVSHSFWFEDKQGRYLSWISYFGVFWILVNFISLKILPIKFVFLEANFNFIFKTRFEYLSFILIKSLTYKIIAAFLAYDL